MLVLEELDFCADDYEELVDESDVLAVCFDLASHFDSSSWACPDKLWIYFLDVGEAHVAEVYGLNSETQGNEVEAARQAGDWRDGTAQCSLSEAFDEPSERVALFVALIRSHYDPCDSVDKLDKEPFHTIVKASR